MKTGYELLVSLDWQTIIIQLINLGIQILLFKKFLYKPVMKILSGGRKAGGAEHEEGVRGQSLEGQ